MKTKTWIGRALHLAGPLALGGLVGFGTRNAMETLEALRQPPLTPPGAVFPWAWSAFYLIMGISALAIYQWEHPLRRGALTAFWLQLALNLIWSPLFFLARAPEAALACLLLLEGALIIMMLLFGRIRAWAAWLQLPYALWVAFAGYLNLGLLLLNPF